MELRTGLQFAAILVLGTVAGTTFGIWRGYNPSNWDAATFMEVHKGAVRGLNLLIPVMGAAALALVVVLAVLARQRSTAFWLYVATVALIVIAAAVTRFLNQPINAQVMQWTATGMPGDWTEIRGRWWQWHELRTVISMAAITLLTAGVLADRGT